jgi:hypothetical protein
MQWTWVVLVRDRSAVAGQVGHGVRCSAGRGGVALGSGVGAVVGDVGLGGRHTLALFGVDGQSLLSAEAKRSTIAERCAISHVSYRGSG